MHPTVEQTSGLRASTSQTPCCDCGCDHVSSSDNFPARLSRGLRAVFSCASSDRLAELDTYRGVAALAVVLFHLGYWFGEVCGYAHGAPLVSVPYFQYGVDLFFMISGFVILMTLERAKRGLDFWVSRLTRLYPTYWLCTLLTMAVRLIAPLLPSLTWSEVLVNVSMMQYYVCWPLATGSDFYTPAVDGSSWTLAIEMNFYALLYLLYAFNCMHVIKWFLLGWVSLALCDRFAASHSALWANSVPVSTLRVLLVLEYAHLFAIGCSFYLILKEQREADEQAEGAHKAPRPTEVHEAATLLPATPDAQPADPLPASALLDRLLSFASLHRLSLAILLLGFVRGSLYNYWPTTRWVYPLYHAAYMALFALMIRFNLAAEDSLSRPMQVIRCVLRWRVLVLLGTVSYPLYLLHQTIGYTLIIALSGSSGTGYTQCSTGPYVPHAINVNLTLALLLVLFLLLSAAVTFWWEQPVMEWLRRRYKAYSTRRQALTEEEPGAGGVANVPQTELPVRSPEAAQ